ncbi:chloramphenicol 3-O phosphotransferase [Paenibacillus castaneae]|nr:chloramphenicol 3-O phosphotransferase [Paenibacillus castaneae]
MIEEIGELAEVLRKDKRLTDQTIKGTIEEELYDVLYYVTCLNFINGLFHSYKDYINSTYPSIETNGAEDGQLVNQILTNPLISLYYSTIKLYSAMGNNVVVDSVIGNDKWFNTCIELLSDHPVIFVVVKCSKEELARREQLRGDRKVGLAGSQYDNVYSFNEYDLEFNTEIMRSSECANEILNFIRSNKEYTAFKKLIKGNK